MPDVPLLHAQSGVVGQLVVIGVICKHGIVSKGSDAIYLREVCQITEKEQCT